MGSRENLYRYYTTSEHAMKSKVYNYDKIIITIVPSYTEKKNHLFVAVGIVSCAAHL